MTPVIAGANPSAVYNALREQRRELNRQLESLEEQREGIAGRLEEPTLDAVDRKGLQDRISAIDQRIANAEQQIAAADARVASAAGVPGAVVEPRPIVRQGPPEEMFIVIPVLFILFVFFPLTLAYVRRLWKRPVAAPVSPEYSERLTRIEQAVDAVAIEVERIGEGQRFMSRVFADPAAARQVEAVASQGAQREAVPAARQ